MGNRCRYTKQQSGVYIHEDADTLVGSALWMRRCGVKRTVVPRIVC